MPVSGANGSFRKPKDSFVLFFPWGGFSAKFGGHVLSLEPSGRFGVRVAVTLKKVNVNNGFLRLRRRLAAAMAVARLPKE